MPDSKGARIFQYCLYAALGVLFLWLLLRFALPWLLPFILALIVARLTEPAVACMTNRFRFKHGFASAVCSIIVVAALILLLSIIIGRAAYELSAFIRELPTLMTNASGVFSSIKEKIYSYIGSAPPEVQEYLGNAIDSIGEKSAELPALLSGKLLNFFSSAVSFAPKLVFFSVTCAISIFFMSSRYHEVTAFIVRQIPERRVQFFRDVKADLISTMGKWLKAQLILCGITAAELTVAFFILGIDYAVLLALLVSLIDALPVLGTGTVLIPWALISLLNGKTVQAVILIITYGVVALVRNCLEPKFIGSQIGLHPVATLIAMYVGFCSVGVLGMVLFPIILIMIKQLNDRGYIKLWK